LFSSLHKESADEISASPYDQTYKPSSVVCDNLSSLQVASQFKPPLRRCPPDRCCGSAYQ